jgi:Tfp pilus assembly protein PilF
MNESAQKSFQAGADLLGPARGDFLFNLGVAKARAKDFLGAEKVYSTLIAENPTIGEAILNRANLRLDQPICFVSRRVMIGCLT